MWLSLTNVINQRNRQKSCNGYLEQCYSSPCDVREQCKEGYSKTYVREPPLRLTLNSGWCGKSCLSYKDTCHVILLAKLHDMYLYKTTTFPHQPLRSISKVAVLHRFHCICKTWIGTLANSADSDQVPQNAVSDQGLHCLLKLQEVKD